MDFIPAARLKCVLVACHPRDRGRRRSDHRASVGSSRFHAFFSVPNRRAPMPENGCIIKHSGQINRLTLSATHSREERSTTCQEADRGSVGKTIMHEVHGPDLVRFRGNHPLCTRNDGPLAMRHLRPQVEALQAIEPVYTLPIDLESLASKKHVNPRVSVADAYGCDLFDARGKSHVEIALRRLVVVCRLVDLEETARASCADLVRRGKVAGAIALLRCRFRIGKGS